MDRKQFTLDSLSTFTVWEDCKMFVVDVYKLVDGEFFDATELGKHLQRAALNGLSTLSKFFERKSWKGKIFYGNIAKSYLTDTYSLLTVAHELGGLNDQEYAKFSDLLQGLVLQISKLVATTRKKYLSSRR